MALKAGQQILVWTFHASKPFLTTRKFKVRFLSIWPFWGAPGPGVPGQNGGPFLGYFGSFSVLLGQNLGHPRTDTLPTVPKPQPGCPVTRSGQISLEWLFPLKRSHLFSEKLHLHWDKFLGFCPIKPWLCHFAHFWLVFHWKHVLTKKHVLLIFNFGIFCCKHEFCPYFRPYFARIFAKNAPVFRPYFYKNEPV